MVKFCDAGKLAVMGRSATKGSQARMQRVLNGITYHYVRIGEAGTAFGGPKAP